MSSSSCTQKRAFSRRCFSIFHFSSRGGKISENYLLPVKCSHRLQLPALCVGRITAFSAYIVEWENQWQRNKTRLTRYSTSKINGTHKHTTPVCFGNFSTITAENLAVAPNVSTSERIECEWRHTRAHIFTSILFIVLHFLSFCIGD